MRFTAAKGRLNLILKGPVSSMQVAVRNLPITGRARRLDDGSPVTLQARGTDLLLTFASPCADPIGTAIAVETSDGAAPIT